MWVGSGGLRNKAFQSSHTSLLGMQNGRAIWEGSLVVSLKKKKKIFFFVYVPSLSWSMQDLEFQHANSSLQDVGSSSLTTDGTQAPCIRNTESYSLVHQGSSWQFLFHFKHIFSK